MSNTGLRIDLLGTSFVIQADEDPLYLRLVVERYRRAIEEARSSTGLSDSLKLAILAGIIVSDEAEKAKHGVSLDETEAERLTLDLIARIDEALSP